jgi:hypothetical protein
MADETTKEVLEVGVDIRSAVTQMAKFQRDTAKQMAEIAKAMTGMGRVSEKVSRKAADDTEDWSDNLDDLKKAYELEGKEITKIEKLVKELNKKSKTAGKDEQANLSKQIRLLKKMRGDKAKNLKARSERDDKYKEQTKDLRDSLKDGFKSFFQKDFKQAAETSLRNIVKGLKLAGPTGLQLKDKGASLSGRGAEKGGLKGGVMQAAGSALKLAGGASGKVGEMVASISKLGPILGLVGGAIVGIVKMFLDLDAKAKEFNKDILKTSGTSEVLAAAGGDTDVAFSNVKDTLRGIRDAAYSLDSIEWGISPEEHKAIIETLTSEGVSIQRIRDEADRSGKSVQAFQTDLAHVSVAYSRAFGVPLQEINQLQGEMMTEMGANLEGTKIAFQQMDRAADDAGIKASKFFSMIRGVSQDLSLWGTRMEDAVKLLGRLGRVMNPREAQKFLQVAVQGLKNMGRTQRLQATLLAGGGASKAIVDRDIKRKAEGLAKTLNMSGDDLMAKMKDGGPAALEDAVQQLPKDMQGAIRSALTDMQLQQKRAGKGQFGVSGAARDLGPAAALQLMQKALLRLSGKSKLSEGAGDIGTEMMAENLGVSEDQLNEMIKFEQTIDNQRDVLKKALESGTDAEKANARKALKNAKLMGKDDEELKKKIDGAGYDEIMDTLDADTKKTLEDAGKTEDFAKKQADLQQSMLDKLGALVDFVMNQLYDIMVDIWDAVTSLTVFGGDKKGLDLKKAMLEVKDPELAELLKKVGGDVYKFRGELMKPSSPFSKNLANALHSDKAGEIEKTIGDQFSKLSDMEKAQAVGVAAGASGVDKGTVGEIMTGVPDGSLSQNLDKHGIKGDQRAALLHQLVGQLDPALLAKIVRKVNNVPESKKREAPPGTPDGAGVPAAGVAPPSPASSDSDPVAVNKDQLATMESIDNQMDKFKMDTGFLSGPYSKAVETSVLSAMRTALFEYYMYKDLNQKDVTSAMNGMSPRAFSQSFSTGALQGTTGQDTLNTLKPHADGGMVTGVSNGMAMVTAAAGEGLASVGRGERIIPAKSGGAPGGNITVNVNGIGGSDLAKVIEAKVIDGIYEYKRRERFTT